MEKRCNIAKGESLGAYVPQYYFQFKETNTFHFCFRYVLINISVR
jgi:hypothetical protein